VGGQVPVGYFVLGPLLVSRGGELRPATPRKRRLVLARLLVDANTAVSVDALIDGLWPDRPPATARKLVQRLVVAAGSLDAERFAVAGAGVRRRRPGTVRHPRGGTPGIAPARVPG